MTDFYLTKELGDDKKGPSLIGKTLCCLTAAVQCTRSVCGRVWFDVYQNSEERKEEVSTES